MFVLVVVRKGPRVLVPRTVHIVGPGETFSDLFEKVSLDNSEVLNDGHLDLVSDIRASKDHAGCGATVSPTDFTKVAMSHPVQEIVETFGLKHIEYWLKEELNANAPQPLAFKSSASGPSQPALSNAFDIMRKAQQQRSFPSKIDKENCIATEKLYNDLIKWGQELCPMGGWAKDNVASSGETFFKCLRDCLWYVDCGHDKLENAGCLIPDCFSKFQGYNKFKENHHKKPIIEARRLGSLTSFGQCC